jgi:hypothetical protein
MGKMIDKSAWGEGPWQHEPDEKAWVDEATGLHCLIRRHPSLGHLCGYVGVPKGHPAYGLSDFPIESGLDENTEWWRRHVTNRVEYKVADISIHGGITHTGPLTSHETIHWFGFDCAHHMDYIPKLGKDLGKEITSYRDVDYVTHQVENLAKQLAAI